MGVTKVVHASFDGDEGSSQGLGNIGTDIQHVLDNSSDLFVLALLSEDIIETGVRVLLLGGSVERRGRSSKFTEQWSGRLGESGLSSRKRRGGGGEGGNRKDNLHRVKYGWISTK